MQVAEVRHLQRVHALDMQGGRVPAIIAGVARAAPMEDS